MSYPLLFSGKELRSEISICVYTHKHTHTHTHTHTQSMSGKTTVEKVYFITQCPIHKTLQDIFLFEFSERVGRWSLFINLFIKDCFGSPITVSSPSPPFFHLSENSKLNQIFSSNDKVTLGPWWHLCFCFFSFSYTFIGNCSSSIIFNFYGNQVS